MQGNKGDDVVKRFIYGEDLQYSSLYARNSIFQFDGTIPVKIGVIDAIKQGARAMVFPEETICDKGALYLLVETGSNGTPTGKEISIEMSGWVDGSTTGNSLVVMCFSIADLNEVEARAWRIDRECDF